MGSSSDVKKQEWIGRLVIFLLLIGVIVGSMLLLGSGPVTPFQVKLFVVIFFVLFIVLILVMFAVQKAMLMNSAFLLKLRESMQKFSKSVNELEKEFQARTNHERVMSKNAEKNTRALQELTDLINENDAKPQ